MSMRDDDDDDLLQFAEEDEDAVLFAGDSEDDAASGGKTQRRGANGPWRLLIVDDEPEVHRATKFVLRDFAFDGKQIDFLHAYTSGEGYEILAKEEDIACVLLDVVMETESAGLDLARRIREDLGNEEVRIILRTGQPGYAPETEVVERYEINDYKLKSELTQSSMYAAIYSAFRSYRQIRTIEANRRGLKMIVESSTDLLAERAVRKFAEGVIIQIAGLIGTQPEGFFLVKTNTKNALESEMLAAVGALTQMIGRPLSDLENDKIRNAVTRAIETGTHYIDDERLVLHMGTRTDESILVHVENVRPLNPVDRQLLEVFASNIGVGFENARLFEEVQHLAYFDALTNVSNRVGFIRDIEVLIAKEISFSLAFLDLDGFHRFNDGLGDETGNAILVATVERIRQYLPEDALLARIGGDGFAVGLPCSVEEAEVVLNAISASFTHLLEVGERRFPIPVTSGVARWPDHGNTAVQLLNRASLTVKQAKDQGFRGRLHSFRMEDNDVLVRTISLVEQARGAVEADQLFMVYQPKTALGTGELSGYEALMRWRRPDNSFVSPGEFIPAFEASGEIIPIGQWMIRYVTRHMGQLKERDGRVAPVAVNISALQLKDEALERVITEALQENGLEHADLDLEITESVFVGGSDSMIARLTRLHEMGFNIVLDDFGTGYSSLSYLQQLPISTLKIDQSFVGGIGDAERDASLVRAILNMCDTLGLKTVAEGVETEAQRDLLTQWGCSIGQGYLFARPMPFEEIYGKS